ncbi:N-acetylgalactosamine-N,N'-diacetylbacillosaminyl-diphospho-undecaprenol 4-alpha-N-acetylgalactosaminyltransferase [Polystyrenella longa]|uniref:N-acetylgalactosamine-N, N'-diacetylbacillosaminyl-diphospho-undecaprenol 4-alpha-N-acetylgalactosaminyltransferase n=1 Tax=Polystyrenella longa TaxID=2528007 RepID=A0A518CJF0_9PLAN|nr:glycosyltransferase [Polystyrenella longa]QDU79356.1 N-acetylgalactosamine-N,N'-diacetylbacillosaminyl-diphospho-undecaprenol 4-alpha-N-acetylgalactosaminyltransferase [Polystyrenella longa]
MPRKIRILFAIGSMGGGGAERQVLQIMKGLDREQFEPVLYLIHHTGELLEEVPTDVPLHVFWERHQGMGLKFPGRIPWTQRRDLIQVMREERIDLVYSRCYLMNLLVSPAATSIGIPHIAAVAVDPEPELKLYRRIRQPWALKWYWRHARRAYQQANVVLTNSNGLRERVLDYFTLSESHVRMIYNLFDVDLIDQRATEPGPSWNGDHFSIVTVARLHAQKGHYYLILAMHWLIYHRGLKQLRLHLVGEGQEEGHLRQLVHRLELDDYVTFAGLKKNPLPMVKQAQLFCLPSLYEGMPNALVEAILCRTPVVSTDCPSGPMEILEEGKWGDLVSPSSYAQLASVIERVVKQDPESNDKLEAARQSMIDRFNHHQGLSQLEDLFRELMAG